MNRMLAWFALDGHSIQNNKLAQCIFKTPHWEPDHQSVFSHEPITMTATQRFITPQCQWGLMPYHHDSGCVINADVYLTNHDMLCQRLNLDFQTADVYLILAAYLKWGTECTKYLAGLFSFIIWDPRHQHLFVAVDPFAQSPLFYIYQPHQFIMLANECSAFHQLFPSLTIHEKRLKAFSKDQFSQTETAYQDIIKVPSGHQLIITHQSFKKTCYWKWRDYQIQNLKISREEYYQIFQKHFKYAVESCTRRIGPLCTQISGGLDSSAVTAQAAILCKSASQPLFSFTSIPQGLHGKSYRLGWEYHELPKIHELITLYPHIQHTAYQANSNSDIFEKIKNLQGHFPEPLRNINNLDWTMASYEHAIAQQSRVLLIGAAGNGSISWTGMTYREIFLSFCSALKAKIQRRPFYWSPHLHQSMLSGHITEPLRASVYPLQLWYGIRRLDPTQDLELSIFCYNLPQWIYRQGQQPLQQRLLVREGLKKILPQSITENIHRGEQGADWYLHYNIHAQKWRHQLQNLNPKAQKILWQCYDRHKVMHLFDIYPVIHQPPDKKVTQDLCLYLLRCLSMAFYLEENLSSFSN